MGVGLSRHGHVAQAGGDLNHLVFLGVIELPDYIEEVSVDRGADDGVLEPPDRAAVSLELVGQWKCQDGGDLLQRHAMMQVQVWMRGGRMSWLLRLSSFRPNQPKVRHVIVQAWVRGGRLSWLLRLSSFRPNQPKVRQVVVQAWVRGGRLSWLLRLSSFRPNQPKARHVVASHC
jgi:hypothetical protein